jgi:hypothetical protein
MARYFFNFRQGSTLSQDEEGSDFASVEDAYLSAVQAARDMWRELLIKREDPLECSFEVVDADGKEIFALPFSEVLDACARTQPEDPTTGTG